MTKFGSHAGLAFGTFHALVYRPFKGGALGSAAHDKAGLEKAGVAAADAARQVALAKQDAQEGTALRKLFGPLAALVPVLTGVADHLSHHHPDSAGISAANAAISDIEMTAHAAGVRLTERAPGQRA